MVKLENRSVEARCRCSRFKKSQFEKTRQINVVLYWLAYDSFHLPNFFYDTYNYGDFSLANSQILIIVDKNAFQCIFLVTIGRRLGFASFDMTSDQKDDSKATFSDGVFGMDYMPTNSPRSSLKKKLTNNLKLKILWKKNRQIKAVLPCFAYDCSILTSIVHLFYVCKKLTLTIT